MKNLIKSFALLICIAGTVLYTSSCEKEEEETTYLEFKGSLDFSLPQFMLQDEYHPITPTGLSRADSDTSSNRGYGLAVTLSNTTTADTIRLETSSVPVTYMVHTPCKDTLGAFAVIVYGFASGYTSSYYEVDCHIVDPELNTGSIQEWTYSESDPYIIDTDGHKYFITSNTTGPVFMRQNYAGSTYGTPYGECSAMRYIFGKYYTWNEAQKACPQGWHLPSQQEVLDFCKMYGAPQSTELNDTYFKVAGNLMVDASFNGDKMWEYWPDVQITNQSGFAALSTGYSSISERGAFKFDGAQEYFCFWTSDEDKDNGVYRYIDAGYDNVYRGVADKDHFAIPVRCCKNK